MKRSIQLITAVCMVCFGVALIVVAMILPPRGVIDPTVLTAYGETLTFAGALIGIDFRYRHSGPTDSDSPPAARRN